MDWGVISKKWWMLVIFGLLLVSGMFAYFSLFSSTQCYNYDCFKENMARCSKAFYINEEPEVSWNYEIKGIEQGRCVIDVTVLQAKEGDLGLERLEGFSMSCEYPKGTAVYPEKDLDRCHGRLKEELQGIIIKNLHAYLIENIGEVGSELDSVV